MKQILRFSSLEIKAVFIDLHGDKWKKLDNVRALSEIYPFVTENFPSEQIVYLAPICPTCGLSLDADGGCYVCFREQNHLNA